MSDVASSFWLADHNSLRYLCVGLGAEHDLVVALELLLELARVLNDTVVHKRDAVVGIVMRVSIDVRLATLVVCRRVSGE